MTRKAKLRGCTGLPADWRNLLLKDVVTINMGQSPPSSSYNKREVGLPFLQGKSEFGEVFPEPNKWCSDPIKLANKRDILISVRAPVGDVNIASCRCCIGRGLASLSVKNNADSIFIFYLLRHLKSSINDQGSGTIFKSINKGILENFIISLPPLSEQQQIAQVLSTVQEARGRTQAVIDAARELKKSLMKHLFTYGPVPLTEVVKVQLKETDVGKLPVHWSLVHLRDLTLRAFGGGTPSTKKPEYWDGPIPWTTTAIIKEEDIYLTKYQRGITEMGLEHSSTKIAQKGTLLVGTRVGVGKAVVATFDIAINQDLTAIKLNSDLANPEFISNLFKTQLIQQWFVSNKRGATIKGVPREDLMTLKIPLPPFHEQQTIVHILQTLDRKLQAEQVREQTLETLFRTLLDNLMTGKIRVNHLEVP
jgi:type I restriction enzyme S subunit